MEYLVSGLVGALAATILSVCYHFLAEQIRLRRETALKAVEWADDIYDRVSELHVHRHNVYNDLPPKKWTL